MNYRKQYRYLLIMATLALAGAWWYSLGNFSSVEFAPKTGPGKPRFVCSLYSGTIMIVRTYYRGRNHFGARSFPDSQVPEDLKEWHHPMGRIGIGEIRQAYWDYPGVEFPIWFPYLILAGGGFLLAERLGRNSTSTLEKRLAQETAVEKKLAEERMADRTEAGSAPDAGSPPSLS